MQVHRPKVSVGISAFNQERYIRQAIDSVLMQETGFEFEVVIHDDCSTDGTRRIIEDYSNRYPDKVRAILQAENQYSQGRRIVKFLLAEMTGEYIALLDGDDLWTDRSKLQTQSDFLDRYPECALCQTQTVVFDERSGRGRRLMPPPHRRRQGLGAADLAYGNFIMTSAVMFRADAVPRLPDEFNGLKFGDWILFTIAARTGWIGYIPAPMAVYRIHSANKWYRRSHAERSKASREVARALAAYLPADVRAPWEKAAISPSGLKRLPPLPLAFAWWHALSSRLRAALRLPPV